MSLEYIEFPLIITSSAVPNRYKVILPGPNQIQEVEFSLEAADRWDLLQALSAAPFHPPGYETEPGYTLLRKFGERLYEAFLSGNSVSTALNNALHLASPPNRGVRIRISLQDVPELARLPWELLCDPEGSFYSYSIYTPVVRCLGTPSAGVTLETPLPLRILGLAASPDKLKSLDLAGERKRLEDALENARARGLVYFHWVEGQTLQAFQSALAQGPWHILHYIGHGYFDEITQEACLALVDPARPDGIDPLPASGLAQILVDQKELRLVVLNACQGSVSGEDPFGSAAGVLLKKTVPAVVAMQHEISDTAALEFSSAFYNWLGEGEPLEVCLEKARQQVAAVCRNMEWVLPVLHLRSSDGQLFKLPERRIGLALSAAQALRRIADLTGLAAASGSLLLQPLLSDVRSLRGSPLPEVQDLADQLWLLLGEQARRWDPQQGWTPNGGGRFLLHPVQWAVECVAGHLTAQNAAAAALLRQWNEQHAGDLGSSPGALAALQNSFNPAQAPAEVSRSLLIYLWDATGVNEQLDPKDRDYTVDIHLWEAGQSRVVWPAQGASAAEARTSLKQIEERLVRALTSLAQQKIIDLTVADTLRIEFLAPPELLDYKFENLRLGKNLLGNMCAVVVRSRDRASQDLITQMTYLGPWRTKWKSYQLQCEQMADTAIGIYSQRQELEDEHTLEAIDSEAMRFCLTLLFDLPGSEPAAARIWEKMLQAGLPITLWPRAALNSGQQDEVRLILKNSILRSLPQRIRERRRAALDAASLGSQLVLLWDDPERLAQEGGRFEIPS